MSVASRHFGHILRAPDDASTTDVGALVRRLLLFDDCTLESMRLREVRPMLNVFGYDGVLELLQCPDFRILYDVRTFGSHGQHHEGIGGPVLPLGSFRVSPMREGAPRAVAYSPNGDLDLDAVRQWCVRRALEEVHDDWSLNAWKRNRLWSELEDRMVEQPEDAIDVARHDFQDELEACGPIFRRSVVLTLAERGVDVDETSLSLRVDSLPVDGDYRVATNLGDFGLSMEDEHSAVERAILGVAGLNHRIALMDAFQALTGFRDNERQLYEAKLSTLSFLAPTPSERTFDRVITLAGLPSVENVEQGGPAFVDRLLALRDSTEWRDFRTWLPTIEGASDEEIEARLASVRGRIAAASRSVPARVVRLLVATGVGVFNLPAGLALGAADLFLVDRVIGSPGPLAAVSSRYRSIFES